MAAGERLRSLGVNETCGARAEHTYTHTHTHTDWYCAIHWTPNTHTHTHTNPDKFEIAVIMSNTILSTRVFSDHFLKDHLRNKHDDS